MKHAAIFGWLLLAFMGATARAADWPAIEGLNFTQRLAVTIENPADVANEAALVHIPLSDLAKAMADAKDGHVAVIDPATPPAKREQADRNFVPFQVNDGTLIFAVPLKAREKKQLYVYASSSRLNLPGFPAKTAYDSRHAYRSFENNLIAHRMETGPGANTTGMAIDAFGKTKAGHGLRLVEVYEQGDYHKLQPWGIDILKLGSSPGIGGAYVIAGETIARPSSDKTFIDCVYQGPVETVVRAVAPIQVEGRTVTLTRTLTLVADDRSIRDRLELGGEGADRLEIGVALRNLPSETWIEQPSNGYAQVTGDHNQPGCKTIGMAAVFNPAQYVRTIPLPDKTNGGHLYVLKGPSSEHRFTAIWDGDGQINNPADLESALKRWAAQRDNPPKITVATESEKHP